MLQITCIYINFNGARVEGIYWSDESTFFGGVTDQCIVVCKHRCIHRRLTVTFGDGYSCMVSCVMTVCESGHSTLESTGQA